MPWGPLHTAAFRSAPEHTERVLSSDFHDVNQREDGGHTPLIIAAQEGNGRVVALLLECGARVDAAADDGATALMMSTQNGHATVIPLLLDAGADVDARNVHGATALFLAVTRADIDAAKLLVEAGAAVNIVSVNNHTLYFAASNGQSAMVDLLIGTGDADVDASDCNGVTPVLAATFQGHLAVVESLVGAGAELDSPNKEGFTPLYAAARYGHHSVVSVLLHAGANPRTHLYKGRSPLYAAASSGHVDTVRELLRANADPAHPVTEEDGTVMVPLDIAAENDHEGAVRELLQLGIEACGGPAQGREALYSAVRNQHVHMMGMLMDAGVTDPGGALFLAIEQGCEAAVKLLVQHERESRRGEYLNHCVYGTRCGDRQYFTPIAHATDFAFPRIARLLLDAGADETAKILAVDKQGLVMYRGTPLALAIRKLRMNESQGKPATEEQIHRLEAIRRMLLQVEAVPALSWLWPGSVPCVICAPAKAADGEATNSETQVAIPVMTVIVGTGARRRAVSRALFRLASGCDEAFPVVYVTVRGYSGVSSFEVVR